MSDPQVSFLMPAHNEERVIHHALDGLQRIAGPAIEVLVGLDGCTDGTGSVVSRYDFPRVVEMDERGGKPAVLRRLMSLARGHIIVIHDADWRLMCDEAGLRQLIRAFEDPQVGGIILPPHNIPFLELREGIQCKGFVGSGLGVLLLSEHLLHTQTKYIGESVYADKDRIAYPFTVDVFRRGVIPNVTTAADDFERFMLLMDAGYEMLIFNDPRLPYFQITDQRLPFRDHFRQRVKGHLSRAQIQRKFAYRPRIAGFHLPFAWYCLKNARRIGLRDFSLVIVWYLTILAALVPARIRLLRGVPDAREAWRYRVQRHGETRG